MFAVFVVAGTLILATGLLLVVRAHATRTWPSTHGEILSSRVHWMSGHHEAYRSEIRYHYSINGERIEGARVSLLDKRWLGDTKASAEWLVAQFPAGRRVEVFYDPRNPRRAVLKHRVSAAGIVLALAGVVFLSATLASAYGE